MARKKLAAGTVALWALAALVVALAGSWGWARLAPRFGHGHGAGADGKPLRVIRVQILNGSGDSGVGTRIAAFLREGGYRVVEVRNADRQDYFASVVVARRSDLSMAREVAHYLGEPPIIRQSWDSDLADVSVLIGSDRSKFRLEP